MDHALLETIWRLGGYDALMDLVREQISYGCPAASHGVSFDNLVLPGVFDRHCLGPDSELDGFTSWQALMKCHQARHRSNRPFRWEQSPDSTADYQHLETLERGESVSCT